MTFDFGQNLELVLTSFNNIEIFVRFACIYNGMTGKSVHWDGSKNSFFFSNPFPPHLFLFYLVPL